MMFFGNYGLFLFIAVVHAALFCFALVRIIIGRDIPESTCESFIAIPKAGIGLISLDPRREKAVVKKT
jgi:hypothetical protein